VRRGLLYAGTETGVFVSLDDGARWRPLQLNLPRASVRDLAVKGADLIAATHGRSFWVLDDVSPLRQMTDSVRAAAAHLLAPAAAVRFSAGRARREGEQGENPPAGAYVDYWLRARPRGPVRLEFLDSAGAVVRAFTGADPSRPGRDSAAAAYTAADSLARLTAYDTTGQSSPRRRVEADSAAYEPADSVPSARAGLNRFVWDLRLPGVRPLKDVVNDEGTYDGPWAVPGAYTVRLTVDGRALTRALRVVDDPRVGASPAEHAATFDLQRRTVGTVNALADAVRRIELLQGQLDARVEQTRAQAYAGRVAGAARPLRGRLEAVRAALADVHSHTDQITLHYPVALYNQLLNVNRMAQSFDRGPTVQAVAVTASWRGRWTPSSRGCARSRRATWRVQPADAHARRAGGGRAGGGGGAAVTAVPSQTGQDGSCSGPDRAGFGPPRRRLRTHNRDRKVLMRRARG
jgi:hypothetical protein